MMTLRPLLVLLLLTPVFFTVSVTIPTKRPHIILIVADDLVCIVISINGQFLF